MPKKHSSCRNLNPPILTPDFSREVPHAVPHEVPHLDDVKQYEAELRQVRFLLRVERRRAASVENVLVNHVRYLERQVENLQSAIFQNLTLRPVEAK